MSEIYVQYTSHTGIQISTPSTTQRSIPKTVTFETNINLDRESDRRQKNWARKLREKPNVCFAMKRKHERRRKIQQKRKERERERGGEAKEILLKRRVRGELSETRCGNFC